MFFMTNSSTVIFPWKIMMMNQTKQMIIEFIRVIKTFKTNKVLYKRKMLQVKKTFKAIDKLKVSKT